jgi:hypothetical protein
MTRFEYHASHEQFTPADLLLWTKYPNEAGFDRDFDSINLHQFGRRQLSFIEASARTFSLRTKRKSEGMARCPTCR